MNPTMAKCAACGRPLANPLVRWCNAAACQRAHVQDLQKQQQAVRDEKRAKVAARRKEARKLRAEAGVRNAASYPLVLLPSHTASLTKLPRRRRQAFRTRLKCVVELAMVPSDAPPPPADDPPTPRALGEACGRCRGLCCREGGDHAFLKEDTIRRYRAAHPGATAAKTLAAYTARLGGETFDGSCVFHGPGGCNLPPDMRSDTCNQFFCEELRTLRRETGGERGFFASVDGDAIRAAAFIDAAGVREAAVKPRRGPPAARS